MTNTNVILEQVLEYSRQGLSVIPVSQDKKPCIPWKAFQTERATEELIREWWQKYPHANVGIVTGAISGIAVVDIEKGGEIDYLPDTVISKTGGDGWHYYYKFDPKLNTKNAGRIKPLTDIRGEGGYVVAPPSRHASGKDYEWMYPFKREDLSPFPAHLFKKEEDKKGPSSKSDWKGALTRPVPQGARNSTATQIIGGLLNDIPQKHWDTKALEKLKTWNKDFCAPPLEAGELLSVFESIKKAAEQNKKEGKKSQSDRLVELISYIPDITFFRNALGEAFVRFRVNEHYEIHKCKSKFFRQWCSRLFWEEHAKTLTRESLQGSLSVFEGRALFDGEEREVGNRVCEAEEAIWYDLGNEEWEAVRITSSGWEIIKNPPILFKRQSHQQAQVTPAKTGDIKDLLDFVNLANKEEQILFLVWMVSAFIPGFPHPIPVFFGPQGAAKSTISRNIKKIVDPSALGAWGFPKSIPELTQQLDHHWCLVFDNISKIPNWASDELCKAVTGGAFSKRELYSDDEDIIFSFQRVIVLNGINLVATKPDLLERSILFELKRIPKRERRSENEVLKKFESQRPLILAGIFETVSKAMKIRPSIKTKELPRMADFYEWGCAISEAMGFRREDFSKAYFNNIESQNKEVLSEDFVAITIVDLLEESPSWEGTTSILLKALKKIAEEKGIDPKDKDFPKSASALGKRLNILKTNLEEGGITFIKSKGRERNITLQVKESPVSSVSTTEAMPSVRPMTGDSSDGRKGDLSESVTAEAVEALFSKPQQS